MKKEDIEFLENLRQELISQDTDYTANPRFWMVKEIKYRPTSAEFSDIETIFDKEAQYEYESEEEFREDLIKEGIFTEEELEDIPDYDLVDYVNEHTTSLLQSDRYEYHYWQELCVLSENSMFLTKRECKEHILANSHHYSRPFSYCMCAWRSPQVEKLINILTQYNWKEELGVENEQKTSE